MPSTAGRLRRTSSLTPKSTPQVDSEVDFSLVFFLHFFRSSSDLSDVPLLPLAGQRGEGALQRQTGQQRPQFAGHAQATPTAFQLQCSKTNQNKRKTWRFTVCVWQSDDVSGQSFPPTLEASTRVWPENSVKLGKTR